MHLKNFLFSSTRSGLINFDAFYNQPIVFFNSASKCGFTKQLKDFQKLFLEKKIIPIALPTNDFGEQEPGNDFEITQYYTKYYDVTFPISDKIDISHDFFKTFGSPDWNFNKYLFNKKHNFVKKFDSASAPSELLNYV